MSTSLYTTIIESSAPTTSTIGVVGQRYLDTATSKEYLCVAVTVVSDVTTYTWQAVASENYVDSAIASAITTALNTPV